MSGAIAQATGTLGARPLGELLIFLLDRDLSGTLVIESVALGKSALSVLDGKIVKVRMAGERHRIGEVCVALDLVDAEDVESVLQTRSASLFGSQLCELGLLEVHELERALVQQRFDQLCTLADLPGECVYGFYQDADFLADWGGPAREVDPLALIWSCLSTACRQDRATLIVDRLGQRELRLHPQARVKRFRFSDEEQVLLDVLRAKPYGLQELYATGLLPPERIDLVLMALALTRHLDLGAEGYPMAVDPSASKIPPERDVRQLARRRRSIATTQPIISDAGATPEVEHRRTEIDEMAERAPAMNYYELLGVPNDAEPSIIQTSFLQLAKLWHPDKLPSPLHDMKGSVTKIFARMTEAHQVLTNSRQRAEYDRLTRESADSPEEQEQVQQLLRAANLFQKAQIAAKRGSWEQAVELSHKAFGEDPEQAEYGALYAYCVAKRGTRRPSELEDLISILDQAVKVQQENLRIRLYRAQVLKIANHAQGALRDFKFVADADPSNVEAMRELRLFKMRHDGSPSAQQGGFWGKLFKK